MNTKKLGGYLMLDLIPSDNTTWDTGTTATGTASCPHKILLDVVREGTAIVIPHLDIIDSGNSYHLHSVHPIIEDSFNSNQEHNATLIFNVSCGENHVTFRFEYTSDNALTMTKVGATAAAVLKATKGGTK